MKKIESKRNESTVQEVNLVIPPDGGYAWIIVFAAFMTNVVVDGIAFSFSISLLPDIADKLNIPASKVAVISSVQLGTYYLFGPLACAFVNHYGFRAVGICGSVISFSGLFIATHTESFAAIITLYGVVAGIGFGMIYTAATISVGYYFEKYRALATGIAVCGSSIGGLSLSPLFAHIVASNGWENTMRIQSYLTLICVLCSLAFRPLKPTTRVPLTQEIISEIDQLTTPSRVEFVELYKTKSMVSIDLDDPSEESRHFPQISIISSRFVPISKMKKSERKCCTCTWLRDLCSATQTMGIAQQNVISTGPMDRKDIFYSASVLNLPEYKITMTQDSTQNRQTMLSYHLSMILDPRTIQSTATTQNSPMEMLADEENTTRCFGISCMFHQALGKLFDISLLKSFIFCLFATACLSYSLAWMTPYIFLPKRGELNEIPESYTQWFISWISIGNAVGRIAAGVLATMFSHLNTCYLVGWASICGGIITIISAFSMTDSANFQIAYCIVFGFCIAFLMALRPIVLVQLLGLDKLTNAFGLSGVVFGIGILSGTPISSALLESSGSFLSAFVLCGALFIVSGVLIILAFQVYLWQERK